MAKQLIYQFDINGQVKTLNFGMYCWEMFCEKMDIGPDEIITVFMGKTTFKAMRLIAYCGIVANDFIQGVPDSVSESDIIKWLNDVPDVMQDIFNAAMKAFIGPQTEKEISKPQKKSPSRSKKSKK